MPEPRDLSAPLMQARDACGEVRASPIHSLMRRVCFA